MKMTKRRIYWVGMGCLLRKFRVENSEGGCCEYTLYRKADLGTFDEIIGLCLSPDLTHFGS